MVLSSSHTQAIRWAKLCNACEAMYANIIMGTLRSNLYALQAYSPLCKATKLSHPVIGKVAARHDKTPAQVSWQQLNGPHSRCHGITLLCMHWRQTTADCSCILTLRHGMDHDTGRPSHGMVLEAFRHDSPFGSTL